MKDEQTVNRREALQRAFGSLTILAAGGALGACRPATQSTKTTAANATQFATASQTSRQPAQPLVGSDGLMQPDANGLRLMPGFRSRIVAESGKVAAGTYVWHAAPDGGACFGTTDGGWIYVSNSESDNNAGGAGALRFDASGTVVDSYSILKGTTRNCAGGATPWNTWLSCEEFDDGQVYECDPWGKKPATVLPALGKFRHEAAAVDITSQSIYLSEDHPEGCLYRYRTKLSHDGVHNWSNGVLEVLAGNENYKKTGTNPSWLVWIPVPAGQGPTRTRVPNAKRFNGGEGLWTYDSYLYLATKGDNRIWQLNLRHNQLSVMYDGDRAFSGLSGVDNLTRASNGDLIVAEDGGDMQIVGLYPTGKTYPIVQIIGQDASEITGPAFSPDGKRLYFSSQRGKGSDWPGAHGITYEIMATAS